MKILIFTLCLFISGCTIYTEKQSEVLSQSVYATKDSIDEARIDLADKYAQEAARIVKPPKTKINISPIYSPGTTKPSLTNSEVSKETANKNRIVIVPEKYKNQNVVVVSSGEYNQLLEDKNISAQLKSDYTAFKIHTENVDKELVKQEGYKNKMVMDLNRMQKEIAQKNLLILRLYIAIAGLSALLIGGVYLRMKGIL